MTESEIISKYNSVDSLQFLLTKPRIETGQKKFIKKILELAHNKSQMIGIIEKEGCGKSTSIAEYFSTHKDAFYIRIGQTYTLKKMFQELIFTVSGEIPHSSSGMFILVKQLSGLLTENRDRKLIIIDDAGKLTGQGLGTFHELRENTQHCVGFAFVGLPYFKGNLMKWMIKGKPGVSEFYRRIENWYDDIPKLNRTEKIEYCKRRGLHESSYDDALACETISELENFVNRRLSLKEIETALGRNSTIKMPKDKFALDGI